MAVPCRACSGVAFCSTTCRDDCSGSYNNSNDVHKFHNYECRFQEVLTGLGISLVARLALRIITTKPYKYYLSLKGKIGLGGIYEGEDYLKVFNLVGLNDKRWPEEKLFRAVLAIHLLSILKAGNYFNNVRDDQIVNACGSSFSANEMFIGSLILRNLQVLQFNAHEVYEMLRGSRKNLKPWKHVAIGLAIYPTAAYFNHSCHPGVARYFIGKEMVFKTLHPVPKGEEVAENYGYAFYLKPRPERRKELEARYWFQCRCVACEKNWPLLNKLPTMGKNEAASEAFEKGLEAMGQGKAKVAAKHIGDGLAEIYSNPSLIPNQEMVRMEDKLRTCVGNMGSLTYQLKELANAKK